MLASRQRTNPPLLLYPPFVATGYRRTYLALPVLASVLKEAGFRSVQLDLNNAFILWYLKSNHYLKRIERARMDLSRFETKSFLSESEYKKYCCNKKLLLLNDILARNPQYYKDMQLIISIVSLMPDMDIQITENIRPPFIDAAHGKSHHLYSAFFKERLFGASIEKPMFAGITIASPQQLVPAIILSRLIKQSPWKGIRTILGGPTMSLVDEEFLRTILKHSRADAAIIGEGEESIAQIAELINSGRWRPEEIANCAHLKGHNLLRSAVRPRLTINEYPAPLYDKREFKKWMPAILNVLTGRGCYWGRCAYCNFQSLYNRRQIKKPEKVVDEVSSLIKTHGTKLFRLVSDTLEPDHIRQLCKHILRKRVKFKWNSFIRADSRYSDGDFALMKKAGCNLVALGLESLDDSCLKLMNKGYTSDIAISFLKKILAAGIEVLTYVIMDLPHTSYRSALKQFHLLKDLFIRAAEKNDVEYRFMTYRLRVLRFSPLGCHPEKYGIHLSASNAGYPMKQIIGYDYAISKGMSGEDLDKIEGLYKKLNGELAQIYKSKFHEENDITIKLTSKLSFNANNVSLGKFMFEAVGRNGRHRRLAKPATVAYSYPLNKYTFGHNLDMIAHLQKLLPMRADKLKSLAINEDALGVKISSGDLALALGDLKLNGLISVC